jgi:hypothetical protein
VSTRYLMVTIDTEVDKDSHWRISDPVSFKSVTEGVPGLFSPLFDRYRVVPTYFLSPEVIEEPDCVAVLRSLGERAELATHLHSEFVEPERRLFRGTMAGQRADALQNQFSPAVETAKLTNLTRQFCETFGYAPTAFRAGRYGISEATLEILASLGYVVDSSITPGLRWKYAEGILDFRNWKTSPIRIDTPAGRLVEMPISIRPGSPLARWVRDLPGPLERLVRRAGGRRASYLWLRPSWKGKSMVRFVKAGREPFLNLMLHSMEVIPGASPYARSVAEARRILDAIDALFEYCAAEGYKFCGITAAARRV